MKCEVYLILKSLLVLSMLSLNLLLLVTNHYFTLNTSQEISIGIKSVEISASTESFDYFSTTCSSLQISNDICSNISNLKSAGRLLLSTICIDIFVLIFYSITSIIQYYIVHSIISKKSIQEPSLREKRLLKISFNLKIVLILHPVIINLGSGLWIKLSNIGEFSSLIKLKIGVIVLIVQCFLSLFVVAIFCWELSSAKRRTARFLKYCESSQKNRKSESVNILSEDKTFDIGSN